MEDDIKLISWSFLYRQKRKFFPKYNGKKATFYFFIFTCFYSNSLDVSSVLCFVNIFLKILEIISFYMPSHL